MIPNDLPRLHSLAQLSGNGGWRLGLQHSRDDHLLIRLTRGGGHAIIRGTRRRLSPHATLFIPAGILFSLAPGPQAMGSVLRFPPDADIGLPEDPHLLRTPNLQDQTAFTRLIEALQQEQDQAATSAFHGAAARAHATLIAIWLRRALLDQPPAPDLASDHRLAAGFADIVARDYRTNRTLAIHARALGVTATHLSRSCRSASGLSAAEILTERRLHAARSLLSDSTFAIGNIAAHLGFRSPAYFSRFVLKHTGLSPSDLRHAIRSRPSTTS